MHGPVWAPETAGVGMAEATVSFDAWKEGLVAPTRHQVQVVAPKPGPKLEPVSPRLKRELIHPDKAGFLSSLRFSPDGKRIIAGSYPGGTVVTWDVAKGNQLQQIETGRSRSTDYLVSPDWTTLFVAREKETREQVQQNGKRIFRWEFDGEVRAWDMATGQLRRAYKHQPGRNILAMRLSPDGTRFVTLEHLPGISEWPKSAASLWDVKTGEHRQLPDGSGYFAFSSDSRVLAVTISDNDGYATAVKLIDSATGKETLSIPIAEKNAWAYPVLSPDGKLVVSDYLVFARAKKWDKSRCWLKWWDAATGREIFSFPGGDNDNTYNRSFSPDGSALALVNARSKERKLFLFSVADARLVKTVLLGEQKNGETLSASAPVYSPDGRWLVTIVRVYPEAQSGRQSPLDLPQARIQVIDAVTGEIRETLVAPRGYVTSPCFSPDGKMLATGGYGRVLLWDMSNVAEKRGSDSKQ